MIAHLSGNKADRGVHCSRGNEEQKYIPLPAVQDAAFRLPHLCIKLGIGWESDT